MSRPVLGRRTTGLLLVLCFAAITVALVRRHHGNELILAFYSAWVAVLVAAGGLAGVALVLLRRGGPATAVALVVSVQLAGTAVVAHKHARPASGMGSLFPADVGMIERRAVVIAVAATVAAVVCLLRLVPPAGDRVGGRLRVLGTTAGVIVAGLVPVAIAATSAEMQDTTSLGAMGLMYGLPWGVGLVAAGWLPWDQAVAAAGTVVGSALLALIGPELVDLIQGRPEPAFAAALLAALLVLAALAAARPAPVSARPASPGSA